MPSIISGSDDFNTASSLGVRGQVFTSSGTFTVPLGVSAVKVTVVGGGGGSGTASGNPACTGGGGGGGTAIQWVTGLTQSSTVSVTVGVGGGIATSGGTSSFGAYCSATGGGGSASAPTGNQATVGGAGGTGSGGNINIAGGAGTAAYFDGTNGNTMGGCGGSAGGGVGINGIDALLSTGNPGGYFIKFPPMGLFGGTAGANSYNVAAIAGTGFGNGAGGTAAPSATDRSGASGSGGIVIVEW